MIISNFIKLTLSLIIARSVAIDCLFEIEDWLTLLPSEEELNHLFFEVSRYI